MAAAGGSWFAAVNHRTNPHGFASQTNPSTKASVFHFHSSNKSHCFVNVHSSRCSSPVLDEEEKKPMNPLRISTVPDNEDSRPLFEPGPDDLNRVLTSLLRDPETRELAYSYYEKAKESEEFRPRTETMKHLIRYLMNSNNWDSVLSLCEDLKKYNVFPDGYTCSKLISSCVRAKKFRIASHLLSVFEADKSLAVSAFDSAMKVYNKLQMFSSTITVFERMRSAGIDPSFGCYCKVMEANKRIGNPDKVLELFQEVRSKNMSFLMMESGHMYVILCSSLAKSGRVSEALKHFEEMMEKGIPANPALYSTMICAFAAAREVEIVEELFGEAAEKKMLTDPEMCLKVVLMYIQEREMEKTPDVVSEMRKSKVRVTDCILCAIVNGFSKQKGFGSAIRVYENLIEHEECEPGQVTYALIINAYCRLELYDKAEKSFEEMERKGFDKCVVAYSNMVDMYGKTRRLSDAMKLVAKMKLKGCKPNIYVYNSLIDMHARAKNVRRVEKIWKEMKRMKVVPDKVTYTSMISAYNKTKEFERCVELYHEFRMNRGEIDRAMAGIMVGVFSKISRFDELMRLLQDMKVQGTRLDGRLYSSALNALRDAGLQVQIRWLQENFEATTQANASRYSAVKNIKDHGF
ncbi:PREDICTED: pentatricopeptide repeat-containing protein At5g13770, chloroplastic [Tarenaya hassleriana]|uniref:pentatricopeptide repeat-containing protein At5g13770, chloroplastic n=1 Tax=Tarenaya hassleriana TaxID=28532 RepID=UPI00053C1C35|nr:PREDICTED: pentatricopeptide repeat-containing protein At5g13770, chloroplastic [Tarenaya hassleriana]